jgi:hypothetical protein
LSQHFLSCTSALQPTVIPTAQTSSFRL